MEEEISGEAAAEINKQKQLSSGNNKATTGCRPRRAGRGCWSFSMKGCLAVETSTPAAAAVGSSSGAAALLFSRSNKYSATSGAGDGDGDGGGSGAIQEAAGVGARLSRKVKEQRARLYIVRRCVSMLVCWRDDN